MSTPEKVEQELAETTTRHNKEWRTFRPYAKPIRDWRPVSGHAVWKWPEFISFITRLGVDYDQLSLDITIEITEEEVVIRHTTRGTDMQANEEKSNE